jgi:hypothetical protein
VNQQHPESQVEPVKHKLPQHRAVQTDDSEASHGQNVDSASCLCGSPQFLGSLVLRLEDLHDLSIGPTWSEAQRRSWLIGHPETIGDTGQDTEVGDLSSPVDYLVHTTLSQPTCHCNRGLGGASELTGELEELSDVPRS